jgi:hypothetical protein
MVRTSASLRNEVAIIVPFDAINVLGSVAAAAARCTAIVRSSTALQQVLAAVISAAVIAGDACERKAANRAKASIAYGIVACSIVAILAWTPATVSNADSFGAGSSPPRFVSHIPMHRARRFVISLLEGRAI